MVRAISECGGIHFFAACGGLGAARSESATLPSREPCLVVPALKQCADCALLYKIVIFGGYILHPLHPLHPLAQALDILAFGGPDMADM